MSVEPNNDPSIGVHSCYCSYGEREHGYFLGFFFIQLILVGQYLPLDGINRKVNGSPEPLRSILWRP